MEEAYEAICFQTGHLRIHVVERVRVERCAPTSYTRGTAGVRQTSLRRQEASCPQGGEASSPKASEDGLSRSASQREQPTALRCNHSPGRVDEAIPNFRNRSRACRASLECG